MEVSTSTIRLRWLLTLVILGAAGFGLARWWRTSPAPDAATLLPTVVAQEIQATSLPFPQAASIGVDIIGAVQSPGLYYVPPGARVDDVITAAGGFAPDADRDAVNLAARVEDEQQLRVPRVGDALAAAPSAVVVDNQVVVSGSDASDTLPVEHPTSGRLDLNTADKAALEALPNIGPVTAQRILDFRAANGRFHSLDQLDEIEGIGSATINSLRDLVIVNP